MEETMEDNTLLRKIQLTQLEIVKEIDLICRNNRIDYYLCAGTALGAIRHNGFIPWDDDLDIMLPRGEYTKLLRVLNNELPKKYWLQSYETDPHYWQPFAKVRKLGTIYKEKGMESFADEKTGVWVDIFPMDFAKKKDSLSLKWTRYWVKMISFTLRVREFNLKNSSFSRRYALSICFLRLFPSTILKKIQERIMQSEEAGASYYVNLASTYEISKETFPIGWFIESSRVAFEDAELPVANGVHKYLQQLYGDYMKLPPEEKRNGHNISEICKVSV